MKVPRLPARFLVCRPDSSYVAPLPSVLAYWRPPSRLPATTPGSVGSVVVLKMRTILSTRAFAPLAVALLSMVLSLAASVAPAQADVGEKIILRCTHGESLRGFTQKDYEKALKELETSLEEYSGCSSLIHQAERAAAGSGGGFGGSGSGGGGSGATGATGAAASATPAERSSLSHAPSTGAAPLKLGGQVIRPGVVHVGIASALSSLPTPLLVILLFLVACAVTLAGGVLRNRVRHHDD